MTGLLSIVSLILPTITGYLFVSWFLRDDPESGILERLFFGFGAGLGLLSYVFFLFGLMDIPFSLPILLVVQALFSLFLLYLFFIYEGGFKRLLFGRVGGPGSAGWALRCEAGAPGNAVSKRMLGGPLVYLALFLLAWVLLKSAFVYYECMLRPLYSVDAWGHWASGAKFFFFERGLALDRVGWGYFGTGYRVDLGYPLLTTFLQVWSAMWMGEFHEVYVKSWAAFYYFSVLGLIYVGVKRELGWVYGVIWVFFVSSSPLLTYHGIEGLADLPTSYYVLASILSFWRYLENERSGALMLSGLFIGMALLTKNEGLLFFIAFVPTLLLSIFAKGRRLLHHGAAFVIPFLLVVGPWMLFKAVEGLGLGHSTSGMVGEAVSFVDRSLKGAMLPPVGAEGAANSFFHPEVLAIVFEKVFLTANFNLIFIFWIVLSVIGFSSLWRSNLKYIYCFLGIVMALFLTLYLTTEAQFVAEGTAIFRNMLTYIPVIFFAAAVLLARIWPESSSGGERE